MRILFVTGLYSKDSEYYYSSVLKKGSLAIPSNVYQWGILKGLVENNVDFEVCSFPFLPTYPSSLRIKKTISEELSIQDRVVGRSYSYCTIAGLKEWDISRKLKVVIKEWATTIASGDTGIILIYSLYGPFLKAAIDCSKFHGNIKVCPIVTDLFIDSLSKLRTLPFLKKIQGYFEYRRIKYGIDRADTFVLLAKGMVKYVPRAVDNHVIVEGIAGDDLPMPVSKDTSCENILLYTGSLGIHTSVKELVDAFLITKDESFRLIICGSGTYEGYIKQKSIEDSRIIFKGNVTRDEAVRLQKCARILINPRLPNIPDTPYSFPSKTIEYLVSGTPMIGYRLIGIPDEYYKYFYIPVDESVDALSELITNVLSLPQNELNQRAYEAWNFIINQKNSKQQVCKILNYYIDRFGLDIPTDNMKID